MPAAEGEIEAARVPGPLQVGDQLDQRPEARPLLLLVDGVDVVVVQAEPVAQGAELTGNRVRVNLGDRRRHGAEGAADVATDVVGLKSAASRKVVARSQGWE